MKDLFEDLKDGTKLLLLLEVLCGKRIVSCTKLRFCFDKATDHLYKICNMSRNALNYVQNLVKKKKKLIYYSFLSMLRICNALNELLAWKIVYGFCKGGKYNKKIQINFKYTKH